MKQIALSVLALATAASLTAQTTTKPKTPVKAAPKKVQPAATAAVALKSLNDSASYAMGVSLASFYKQQGFTTINSAMVSRAITDVMANRSLTLDENACNNVMNQVMTDMQNAKAKPNLEKGAAFLRENKTKPGVKITPSGLQYQVVSEGTGIKPAETDTVSVRYLGSFIDGTVFENVYRMESGQSHDPISFPLNRVISGWTEGLQLMSVGSIYKFFIPQQLGYGLQDNGKIPGASTLIFQVELVDVKKAK